MNDSKLKKDTIEKLTYALCHYYYNWSGPIKVPAPCMYAHKIAELFTNIAPHEKDFKKF
jgi:aubergine-like protein